MRECEGVEDSLSLSLPLPQVQHLLLSSTTDSLLKNQTLVGRWFGIVLPDADGWSRDDDDDVGEHIF